MEEEEGEHVVTMSEYIEHMEAEELRADLVLGGDDGNECTYPKGYMARQAVFSCLSCTPSGDSGVCTACSISCHDGHEVVELWTRRHFRCDCGNSKFGAGICRLYGGKDVENLENLYNQNYKGVYCICKRPYPDPDGEDQGEMLQCCICEDWFHENHLGLRPNEQVPRDEEGEPTFDELVCQACAGRLQFFAFYQELQVPLDLNSGSSTKSEGLSSAEIHVANQEAGILCEVDSRKVEANLPSDAVTSQNSVYTGSSEPSVVVGSHKPLENGCTMTEDQGSCDEHKSVDHTVVNKAESCILERKKLEKGHETCSKKIEANHNYDHALFMCKNWRTELCHCDKCLDLYSTNKVTFLLDPDDTLHKYEEVATQRRKEKMEADGAGLAILKSLDHVGQIEFLHKVNDMANEMSSFFESFKESGKTVTSADVHEFFDNLKQKRRRVE